MKSFKKSQLLFVLFGTLISINVNAALSNVEYEALIAFYVSTNGEDWTDNSNWLVGDPCDADILKRWHGVTCVDADGDPGNTHVGGIGLVNNNLTGTIPERISDFKKMYSISLRFNRLSGGIPVTLSATDSLIELENIDFRDNELTGSIPPQLGSLYFQGPTPGEDKGLLNLQLSNNQLSQQIPSSLGNLGKLKLLDLDGNQLDGSIPDSFGNLQKLQTLRLSNNQLTGSIPSILGNLTGLTQIWLNHNKLTSSIPVELSNINGYYGIDLSFNSLTGPIPSELGSMNLVPVLNLSSNQLSGLVPMELVNLTRITGKTLNLNYNSLYSENSTLIDFINAHNPCTSCGNWLNTQTHTPINFQVIAASDDSISLNWGAIPFQQDGGYKVLMSSTDTGTYSLIHETGNKAVSAYTHGGLAAGQDYYFKIQSFTNPHEQNPLLLTSDASNYVLDTTDVSSSSANLGIEITAMSSLPNNRIEYKAIVSNAGINTVTNANFIHEFPQALYSGTWSCANETGGANCPVVRSINASNDVDLLLTLPESSSLEFTFASAIDTAQNPNAFVAAFTITPPDGISDTDLSNNVQFMNFELLFKNNFE